MLTQGPQNTRSVIMCFAKWKESGVSLRSEGQDQPSLYLRISLEDQAAFWAFAYLTARPPSAIVQKLAFSAEEEQHITGMLEFFKNDHGQEFPVADANNAPGNQDPPGYTGERSLVGPTISTF